MNQLSLLLTLVWAIPWRGTPGSSIPMELFIAVSDATSGASTTRPALHAQEMYGVRASICVCLNPSRGSYHLPRLLTTNQSMLTITLEANDRAQRPILNRGLGQVIEDLIPRCAVEPYLERRTVEAAFRQHPTRRSFTQRHTSVLRD